MLNLVQLQERLKDLPMQALMQYANGMNPQVPPFLALGELNRRKKMQESAAAEQAQEMAGAPTVKEQIEQATGLMSLQGARQRQAAQDQASMQANMPMAAPNTMTSEPAQMASGGAVDDVMPRDYQRGGIAMNPEMIKKLMMLKAMKGRRRPEGLTGLPMRADMFKRRDYAGGGIVAFAGDTDGSFVETSPGFYEQKEEEDEKLTPAQRFLMEIMEGRKTRPDIAERRRQAGLPTEAPDTTASTRAELERRQKELETSDTFVNRLMALQPGKFGSGRLGESVAKYEEGRMAKMNEVRKLKAAAEDQREAAKIAFKEGRFAEAEKDLDQADKFDLDAARVMGDIDYKAQLGEQARAGRTAFDDRAAQAYVRARKAQGDPRPEEVLLDEGYLRVLRERGASFKRAETAGEVAGYTMADKARDNVDKRLSDFKSDEFRKIQSLIIQDNKNKKAGNPTNLAEQYKLELYRRELNALQGRGSASASTQTQAGSASDPLGIRR